MAEIVNVTDTFSFWREQFNALVGEVGVKKYFKTPQDFGAVGDGLVDDTSAFNIASLQSVPVYIPPGVYKITNNYAGENKFFDFGGVSYVGGGSVVPGFSLNVTGNLQLNKNVSGLDPVLSQHLTTKQYVDGLNASEVSARTSADALLNNKIDLAPTAGSWWNNGIPRVYANGVTKLGAYLDLHASNTSADEYDVRIRTTNISSRDLLLFGAKGVYGESVMMDLTLGTVSLISKSAYGTPTLALNSDSLASADPFFPGSNTYGFFTMFDDHGGTRIRSHYHNGLNRAAPALILEGVKNDDGQLTGEWAHVSVNAYSLSAPNVGVGSNPYNNIFGVYNNGDIRFGVKGDGRLLVTNSILFQNGLGGQFDTQANTMFSGYVFGVPVFGITAPTSPDNVFSIIGNHVHATSADLSGYSYPNSEKLLTTKEYVNDFATENYTGNGTSGSVTLPGGLKMIWGTATSNIEANQTFSFSSPFSTDCYFVNVSINFVYTMSWTNSGFTINRSDENDGSVSFKYFAIGK